MHGTALEKARTDSHQVGSSCDRDLVPASLTGSSLRGTAVTMARPTANLRPGSGGGIGGPNGATAASAAQLNFYEELCNRQLYRSSLHNLLTSCGGSPAGSVSTGCASVEARCLTLGRNPMAPGSSAELQRRAASVAALATGRPETPACGMSAVAAAGSGSPPHRSHVPHSAARSTGSGEATHALLPHSGLSLLEGATALPFGQLGLLLPPPAAAVATAAAAGLHQRSAMHRRARSMDESTSRQQKRTDAAATSGAGAGTAAAATASPAPAAQLPASADRLHSSQATAAEQQQQQAVMAVKPRPPAACGGAAFKKSVPDPAVPVAIVAGAVSASSSAPTVGVVVAGAQKVVLRKSLSSSSGDRGRSLSCTPLDEKECCLPPPVPPPPPPVMAAAPAAVGGGFGEGTAGGSAAAVAKTQGTAAVAVVAAHAHQGAAARTSAAAASAARQRHAMHVDDSNYVVMSPIHVRSSSGIVEGCTNRTSASSSLSGDRRHSARSLEELSAGGSTQPLLPEPPHSGDRSSAVARGGGSASSGSRTFHPGCGPQPASLLPCSASGDITDRRVGIASNAAVQAVGGACYADNTYENVYRNGMPLCEPVVYANVSSIIRSRAVLTSAAKAELSPASSEGRCTLPPSLPPLPLPATETHLRSCTPPAGALPSSAADGVPATQSTVAASGAHRSSSSTAASHVEPVLSPTSSVASGSSVFARMPSSCSVSNSSINSCVVVAERDAQVYTSASESHSPAAASSPTEDGERPGSRGTPLYVNVQECLLPSCMPTTGGCGSRSSPRPASPPPELNYAELMHTAPPAMVASSSGGSSSSSGSLARKRLSPCHPPTTLLRGSSSGSGTGAKVDSSSDGVLYAEINIAATEAAHKAQVHQTRYRQEQRNGLRADGGSSAQPTTAGMADR